MTALARLRIHKEFRRYCAAMTGLRRTWEKQTFHAIPFRCLRCRRHLGILNAIGVTPANFPCGPCRTAQRKRCSRKHRETKRWTADPAGEQDHYRKSGNTDVRIKQTGEGTGRARPRESDSKNGACGRYDPTGRSGPSQKQKNGENETCCDVPQDQGEVRNRRRGKSIEIKSGQCSESECNRARSL